MIPLVALLLLTASITAAYKGIPDSEDKAFVFEQGEYSCVSQKTLPKNFNFVNTWMGRPLLYVLSDDAQFNCPNDFIFGLTRKFYFYEMMITVCPDRMMYRVREVCKTPTLKRKGYAGSYTKLFTKNEKIRFRCPHLPADSDYYNVEYSVFTNNSCNFWLCMGHLEQFKRQQQYPAFTLPVDRENYYLAGDNLPKELQTTDTGFAIDVLKASGQVFTVYKTPKRPIQTIEIKTPRLCSSMVISMDFDGMCTISVDFGPNQVTYYVNGISTVVTSRATEIVLTFTNSTAHLYTFQPLGFYPLNDCKLDPTLIEKSEYNLKVWYDETRVSSSCETIKLQISDAAAIKHWTTMTTTSTTTTTTTVPTEAPTTEFLASTASTKIWAVVAVVCFTALVVVIVSGLLLIWWLKKH